MKGRKKNIDEFLKFLNNVPFTIQKKVKVEVNVAPEGEEESIRLIDTVIDIDNADAKLKAVVSAEKLISYTDKLKNMVFKEQREENKTKRRRLFQDPDEIESVRQSFQKN